MSDAIDDKPDDDFVTSNGVRWSSLKAAQDKVDEWYKDTPTNKNTKSAQVYDQYVAEEARRAGESDEEINQWLNYRSERRFQAFAKKLNQRRRKKKESDANASQTGRVSRQSSSDVRIAREVAERMAVRHGRSAASLEQHTKLSRQLVILLGLKGNDSYFDEWKGWRPLATNAQIADLIKLLKHPEWKQQGHRIIDEARAGTLTKADAATATLRRLAKTDVKAATATARGKVMRAIRELKAAAELIPADNGDATDWVKIALFDAERLAETLVVKKLTTATD